MAFQCNCRSLTIPPPSWPRMTGKMPLSRRIQEDHTRPSSMAFTYLRVFSATSVLISVTYTCCTMSRSLIITHAILGGLLTGVEDVNTHFVSLRRSNLDLLDFERFACAPADCGLAFNNLTGCVVRHGYGEGGRTKKGENANSHLYIGGPLRLSCSRHHLINHITHNRSLCPSAFSDLSASVLVICCCCCCC